MLVRGMSISIGLTIASGCCSLSRTAPLDLMAENLVSDDSPVGEWSGSRVAAFFRAHPERVPSTPSFVPRSWDDPVADALTALALAHVRSLFVSRLLNCAKA